MTQTSSSFVITPGERFEVRNSGSFAMVYRVTFAGSGMIEVALSPGQSLWLVSDGVQVDIHAQPLPTDGPKRMDDAGLPS